MRYEFPKSVLLCDSFLVTIITESNKSDCSDSFAYIADPTGFQLIVFDYAKKESWSVNNKLFYPYPDEGTLTISGVTFVEMDGIFGMAISISTAC